MLLTSSNLKKNDSHWIRHFQVGLNIMLWEHTYNTMDARRHTWTHPVCIIYSFFSVFERIFRCAFIVSEIVIDGNIVILSRVGFFFSVGFLEVSRVVRQILVSVIHCDSELFLCSVNIVGNLEFLQFSHESYRISSPESSSRD